MTPLKYDNIFGMSLDIQANTETEFGCLIGRFFEGPNDIFSVSVFNGCLG